MSFNGTGPDTADLASRPATARWAIEAGFPTIYEAENAGCFEHNAHQFAAGQKTVDPFLAWPDGSLRGMFDITPQPVPWFAEDRIMAGRAVGLVGLGGTGKTRLLYHLGIGAVTGKLPWSWQIQTTGSAALFLAEDTVADVHRAMHRLGEGMGDEERKTLVRQLRVFPLAGKPARMLELDGSALRLTAAYDWLMQQIDRLPKPVACIGLDPALALTEGDELSQAHQRRLGEMADAIAIETGAAVILTAHAAKALMQADELGSHSARGGGALTDALRGEFVVRNMTGDEARKFGIDDRAERQLYVQLAGTKGNHLPPDAYAPVWLKRGAGGVLSEVTLAQVERGTVGHRELQALEILRRTAAQGDSTLKFWRTECVSAGLISASAGTSAQEKAMQRIRDALREAGLVSEGRTKGSWIPT